MAETPYPARPDEALWQRAREGDHDAFEEAIEPHREALLRAARTSIQARRADGDLNEDALTPEELAGETLLRAFDGRDRYDAERMGLRAWLLALQQRALNHIAASEARYTQRKAISLDEEVPTDERFDHVEESFYEFNSPFEVTTFEDIIPAQTPDDVELDTRRSLTQEELAFLEDSGLDPTTRQIVELHDEFDLSISEVSQILEIQLDDLAESIGQARAHVRQRMGGTLEPDLEGDDDAIDSYTGEPVENNPNYTGERGPTADEPAEGRLTRASRDASTNPPSTTD